MALRKPLVLVSGEIQQLQSGDSLSGNIGLTALTNGDAATALIGEIMYISAADTVIKAKANASGTTDAAFFANSASTAAAAVGDFQSSGVLAGLSGLTAGATYYLSAATAGAMTTTPPSSTGQYVVRLGKALSTTEFLINIERAILL